MASSILHNSGDDGRLLMGHSGNACMNPTKSSLLCLPKSMVQRISYHKTTIGISGFPSAILLRQPECASTQGYWLGSRRRETRRRQNLCWKASKPVVTMIRRYMLYTKNTSEPSDGGRTTGSHVGTFKATHCVNRSFRLAVRTPRKLHR